MTTDYHGLEAQLIDDGTLDTVIRCTGCGWVGRYNSHSQLAELIDDEATQETAWELADQHHYHEVHEGLTS